MIELHSDSLVFRFPDTEAFFRERIRGWIDSRLTTTTAAERSRLPVLRADLDRRFDRIVPTVEATVSFERTLRIPDDGRDYPLPPGLGEFPVRHVDDFAGVPESWKRRGGAMLPMHWTEATWLRFSSEYPVALKVGAGGICAISGERWAPGIRNPRQNYVVLPEQPWLDGFRVSEGVIRQFVAVPLGKGLTVEHQLTGEETWGGLQLQAHPLNAGRYWKEELEGRLERMWETLIHSMERDYLQHSARPCPAKPMPVECCIAEAGMGAGGRMRQEITGDIYGLDAWDLTQSSRCFVHLCLADDWQRLTGTPPPHRPPTAQDYARAGLPWFEFDAGKPAVPGGTVLAGVKSVNTLVKEKTGLELADNVAFEPANVTKLVPRKSRVVREF